MTFFIPPVFLFGNNANRFHNNKEEKAEYKTAAETEIKVENWRVKRIAELEEENKKLKEKIKRLEFDVDAWYQLKLLLEGEIERLGKERDEYKEKLNNAGLEEYGFFNEY